MLGRFYWQLLPDEIRASIHDTEAPDELIVCSFERAEFVCAALNAAAEREKLSDL